MEYFTVCCQRQGRVWLDGVDQGENRSGGTLRVFQCSAGLHDITLECLTGRRCRVMTQRLMIAGSNAIVPARVNFLCDL